MKTNPPPRWGVTTTPSTGRRRTAADMLNELSEAGKSLTAQQPSTLLRNGAPWSIDQQWAGNDMTHYTIRYSAWTRTYVISFFAGAPEVVKTPAFVLHLALETDADTLVQQGEVWMMMLNTRRLE